MVCATNILFAFCCPEHVFTAKSPLTAKISGFVELKEYRAPDPCCDQATFRATQGVRRTQLLLHTTAPQLLGSMPLGGNWMAPSNKYTQS